MPRVKNKIKVSHKIEKQTQKKYDKTRSEKLEEKRKSYAADIHHPDEKIKQLTKDYNGLKLFKNKKILEIHSAPHGVKNCVRALYESVDYKEYEYFTYEDWTYRELPGIPWQFQKICLRRKMGRLIGDGRLFDHIDIDPYGSPFTRAEIIPLVFYLFPFNINSQIGKTFTLSLTFPLQAILRSNYCKETYYVNVSQMFDELQLLGVNFNYKIEMLDCYTIPKKVHRALYTLTSLAPKNDTYTDILNNDFFRKLKYNEKTFKFLTKQIKSPSIRNLGLHTVKQIT